MKCAVRLCAYMPGGVEGGVLLDSSRLHRSSLKSAAAASATTTNNLQKQEPPPLLQNEAPRRGHVIGCSVSGAPGDEETARSEWLRPLDWDSVANERTDSCWAGCLRRRLSSGPAAPSAGGRRSVRLLCVTPGLLPALYSTKALPRHSLIPLELS